MFFSDAPLKEGIPHVVLDKLDHGVEGYYNMWQKVRSIWRYTHEHFAEDFDYFTMSGDDDYYVMENLRQFLLSPAIAAREAAGEAVYLGRRLLYTGMGDLVFNTGGAGYVLNRVAMDKLVEQIKPGNPLCKHDQQTHEEDVNVARCLKSVGVLPLDTRDGSDGSERFHMLNPQSHYSYRIGSWGKNDWFASYSKPFDLQVCDTPENRCASRSSITYHYLDPSYMNMLEKELYECRQHPDGGVREGY
jgi:glycoprotein-N-acetylgalactosamine 3-beta-galactosyltransferase